MEAIIINDRTERNTLSNENDMSMTDAGLFRKTRFAFAGGISWIPVGSFGVFRIGIV